MWTVTVHRRQYEKPQSGSERIVGYPEVTLGPGLSGGSFGSHPLLPRQVLLRLNLV